MATALTITNTQTADVQTMLLANRKLLNLQSAQTSLVTRLRVRTPLGAAEYLRMRAAQTEGRWDTSQAGRETLFEQRVSIAITVMELYQLLFPREYSASQSPSYSVAREHEFYRLVARRLFPLDLEPLDSHPEFFMPGIIVRGAQEHDWTRECCPFASLQTSFKVARVLGGAYGARGWERLRSYFQLPHEPVPAAPLGALGWTQFTYACRVDGSRLKDLPLAFNFVNYKTGNPWLDTLPGAYMGFDWSPENVAKLLLHRQRMEAMNGFVLLLDRWFEADPQARITRVIEMWNRAAALEDERGVRGMMVEDMR